MKKSDLIVSIVVFTVFGVCYYFVSKGSSNVAVSSALPENPTVKTFTKRDINPSTEAVKIVKEVPISKEVSPAGKLLDPNAKLDDSFRNQQQEIASKGYGSFPPVDMEKMNPNKEYLLNALKDPQNNPGAISIVGKREKFNLEEYKQDPQKYLNIVAPGRAFDCAQAAEGVKPIQQVGEASLRVKQNESITLQAKGLSNMPISFTVFDGGIFEQNGLNSITLQADASGLVSVEYIPTSGVINQVRIRAASPVNSGTLEWIVNVSLPDSNTDEKNQN